MSKFYVFSWERYDPSGGFFDFVSEHETHAEAEAAILSLRNLEDRQDHDVAQVVFIDSNKIAGAITTYDFSDGYYDPDGSGHSQYFQGLVPEPPRRWVKRANGTNLADGQIVSLNLSKDEADNLPGSKNNPLPYPQSIIDGTAAWRGMMTADGLFWNRDGGLYYKPPEEVK